MACECFVEHLVDSLYFLQAEVVPKIFLNLNVVGHLAVPVGWGSCLPRLAIFMYKNPSPLANITVKVIPFYLNFNCPVIYSRYIYVTEVQNVYLSL